MGNLHIGVDLSDSLNNIGDCIAAVVHKRTGLDCYDALREHYYLERAIGWSSYEVSEFFRKYSCEILDACELKPMAHQMLIGLKMRSMDLSVLMHRVGSQCGLPVDDMTIRWLADRGVLNLFKEVHMVDDCKTAYIKDKGLTFDAVVEDNPRQAEAFLEAKIPVVLFDYPHNRRLDHPMLHRVTNWFQAYEALTRIQLRR